MRCTVGLGKLILAASSATESVPSFSATADMTLMTRSITELVSRSSGFGRAREGPSFALARGISAVFLSKFFDGRAYERTSIDLLFSAYIKVCMSTSLVFSSVGFLRP